MKSTFMKFKTLWIHKMLIMACVLQLIQSKTGQAKAQRLKEDIRKLMLQMWTSLTDSVKSETEKWKISLIRNDWCSIGPYWKLDKLGLPRQYDHIEQPVRVQNRRKFLETLNTLERNIVLTGDPLVEFYQFTYVLQYSFPHQANNYPAIAQALPHLIPNQDQTPQNYPPLLPNVANEDQFFSPVNTPPPAAS